MDIPQNPDHAGAVKPAADSLSNIPTADASKTAPPSPVDDAEAAPPLTPVAWMKQNGFYLVFIGAIIALIIYKLGWSGLWQCFLAAVGLGFVVFIHELGHFATAKWCDVHVQTFSLGFGPALPGCSFRYGETLYKIALFPLGGYVGMVGEGTELEGNDDYPRSFKNKPVGQRMLIISAGVIMNVLFGCLAFVLVYRIHGIEEQTMDVSATEAGGPAWKEGVRSGSTVTQIGDTQNPFFKQLQLRVLLSSEGEALTFHTKPRSPEGSEFDGKLTPRSDKNDPVPVIGIATGHRLALFPERAKSFRAVPVYYNSAAMAARVVDVAAGTRVLEATYGGDQPQPVFCAAAGMVSGPAFKGRVQTPVRNGWSEVGERMLKLRDQPIVVRMQAKDADKSTELTIEPPAHIGNAKLGCAFQWDDVIVGTTDPDQGDANYDPFLVKPLPLDKANEEKVSYDYFEFHRRMKQLMSKTVVIQVQRQGAASDAKPVSILVPPEYHRSLGMRMRMGEVAAVRNNSPASEGGLQPGDSITGVRMTAVRLDAIFQGSGLFVTLGELTKFDPCRLPYELEHLASKAPGTKLVTLTVDRPNPAGTADNGEGSADDKHKASKEVTIGPLVWDDTWRFNEELPLPSVAALSIAELGIAYRVDSTIVSVADDSPAARAGLQPNDEIIAIAFRKPNEDASVVEWQDSINLESYRGEQKRCDRWAYIDYALQGTDFAQVQFQIRRGGAVQTIPADLNADGLTADLEMDWPEVHRGLLLSPDTRLQKADSLWGALKFGVSRTGQFILNIYQTIRSLATGRVSRDVVQGPVGIAKTVFFMAEDPFEFLLILGMISVNLAVVNFLPIPVLDGGHMVFLIYEKLRGKPASETVQKYAMIVGLLLIGLMIAFVLYKEVLIPIVHWKWRFF